jgi:hypothetical protein
MFGLIIKQLVSIIVIEVGVTIARVLQRALSRKIKTWAAF